MHKATLIPSSYLTSQWRESLFKVYGTNSKWRHFRPRTKPTRSDLYLPFMVHYRVGSIRIEER